MSRSHPRPPRGLKSKCPVCDKTIGGGTRGRMDCFHRHMCSAHGKAAIRHAEIVLRREFPRLAKLIADRPELAFIRRWLHPDILERLNKFPNADRRHVLVETMPYYHATPTKCCPKRTAALSDKLECEYNGCGGEWHNLCRWGNHRVCTACFWRLRRTHIRAARHFLVLYRLVRKTPTAWVFGLLHTRLQQRLQKHATTAAQKERDSEWV